MATALVILLAELVLVFAIVHDPAYRRGGSRGDFYEVVAPSCACRNASAVWRMPNCSPSGPITRTSRTRISRFTRSLGTIGHLLVCRLKVRLGASDVISEHVDHRSPCHAAKVCPAPSSDREGTALNFPVSRHQHERDFGLFGLTDFETNLLIAKVRFGAKAAAFSCETTDVT